MDASKRTFAACIGEVNNLYLNHDPRVVGATYLLPTADYEFGVSFLVPTKDDATRGHEQGLLTLLTRGMEEAMERHGMPYDSSIVYVALSSLEAEGIRRSSPAP